MKKIFSLSTIIASVVLFFIIYIYTKDSFDYHIADFLSYVFIWTFTLFIFSLFASRLIIEKYKIWLIISVIFSLLSLFLAYMKGDGNGAIFDINGELITLFFAGLYSFISIIYFSLQFFKKDKNLN